MRHIFFALYTAKLEALIRHKGCLESIQPFWISREPVAWPWCNWAASQRRPYRASAKSRSQVGLVSRQWDAVNWACVRCDRHIPMTERADHLHHDNVPAHSTALVQTSFPPRKASHHPRLSAPPTVQIWLPATSGFSQRQNHGWKGGVSECDGHTVHKLSQRRLTADWLAPRDSDCSRVHSKVSPDWMPSYIKATRPVFEIFRMAGYFPDSPRFFRPYLPAN